MDLTNVGDIRAVGLLAQLSGTRRQLLRTLRRAPQPLLHRGDEPRILVAQPRPRSADMRTRLVAGQDQATKDPDCRTPHPLG